MFLIDQIFELEIQIETNTPESTVSYAQNNQQFIKMNNINAQNLEVIFNYLALLHLSNNTPEHSQFHFIPDDIIQIISLLFISDYLDIRGLTQFLLLKITNHYKFLLYPLFRKKLISLLPEHLSEPVSINISFIILA